MNYHIFPPSDGGTRRFTAKENSEIYMIIIKPSTKAKIQEYRHKIDLFN